MSRGPDAATLFERALDRAAVDAEVAITIDAVESTRWASATFTGARHALRIETTASAASERWIASLEEHEFALRGHLVADLTVASVKRTGKSLAIQIEALTVEDR